MDQTSVIFGALGVVTVESRGVDSVPVRSSESPSDRVTVTLSIASNGAKLLPFVIFRGTCHGRVSREFVRRENPFPDGLICATTANAWMTEDLMMQWIDTILVPFAGSTGRDAICLVLDSFQVHLKDTVKEWLRIEEIDFVYIPGGLTGELQPLDIGINGPFKRLLRDAFIETAESNRLTTTEKRLYLAQKISECWSSISEDSMTNSFGRMLITTLNDIGENTEIE